METSAQQLPPGTELGSYTIIRSLSVNYQYVTYLATDRVRGGKVVLRESMPSGCNRDNAVSLFVNVSPEDRSEVAAHQEAFQEGARIIMGIEHQNIAKITDCFTAFGTVYYASSYIEGCSMEEYREKYGAPSNDELQSIVAALLDALLHLHEHGLLHKDIRPANILMQGRDKPVIVGFCPPRELSNQDYHSEDYQYSAYCAPEQLWMWSAGTCGPWTDTYALGAVLYAFITGTSPHSPFARLYGRPFFLDAPVPYESLVVQESHRSQYSGRILASIDKALSLRLENRWLCARDWMNYLREEASTRVLPPGFELGDYTIERELGQGGFGVTYLACNKIIQQRVVLKELLPVHFAWRDLAHSPEIKFRVGRSGEDEFSRVRQNFIREARILANLSHPNIISVLNAFTANGTLYYVMPYIEGISLDAYCRNHEAPTETWLRHLLKQLLEALTYLSHRDILHLDIKPANILLSAQSCPVLIDFGTSRPVNEGAGRFETVTHGYVPKEILAKSGRVGVWSDIYALGATFYTLLTGEIPSDCYEHEPLVQREPLLGRYSRDFLGSIDKAMSVEAEDRWQHPGEWLFALEKMCKRSDAGDLVAPPAANVVFSEPYQVITEIIPTRSGISVEECNDDSLG